MRKRCLVPWRHEFRAEAQVMKETGKIIIAGIYLVPQAPALADIESTPHQCRLTGARKALNPDHICATRGIIKPGE